VCTNTQSEVVRELLGDSTRWRSLGAMERKQQRDAITARLAEQKRVEDAAAHTQRVIDRAKRKEIKETEKKQRQEQKQMERLAARQARRDKRRAERKLVHEQEQAKAEAAAAVVVPSPREQKTSTEVSSKSSRISRPSTRQGSMVSQPDMGLKLAPSMDEVSGKGGAQREPKPSPVPTPKATTVATPTTTITTTPVVATVVDDERKSTLGNLGRDELLSLLRTQLSQSESSTVQPQVQAPQSRRPSDTRNPSGGGKRSSHSRQVSITVEPPTTMENNTRRALQPLSPRTQAAALTPLPSGDHSLPPSPRRRESQLEHMSPRSQRRALAKEQQLRDRNLRPVDRDTQVFSSVSKLVGKPAVPLPQSDRGSKAGPGLILYRGEQSSSTRSVPAKPQQGQQSQPRSSSRRPSNPMDDPVSGSEYGGTTPSRQPSAPSTPRDFGGSQSGGDSNDGSVAARGQSVWTQDPLASRHSRRTSNTGHKVGPNRDRAGVAATREMLPATTTTSGDEASESDRELQRLARRAARKQLQLQQQIKQPTVRDAWIPSSSEPKLMAAGQLNTRLVGGPPPLKYPTAQAADPQLWTALGTASTITRPTPSTSMNPTQLFRPDRPHASHGVPLEGISHRIDQLPARPLTISDVHNRNLPSTTLYAMPSLGRRPPGPLVPEQPFHATSPPPLHGGPRAVWAHETRPAGPPRLLHVGSIDDRWRRAFGGGYGPPNGNGSGSGRDRSLPGGGSEKPDAPHIAAIKSRLQRYERTLLMQEQQIGPNSPEVADTLLLMGDCYAALGDQSSREACARRALQIRTALRGPDHIDTIRAAAILAECLLADPTKQSEALKLLTKIATHPSSINDPTVAACVDRMINELNNQGRTAELEPIARAQLTRLKKALSAAEDKYGANSIEVADILMRMANCSTAIGDHEMAEIAARQALTMREQLLGPDHAETARAAAALAQSLIAQRDDPTKVAEGLRLVERLASAPSALNDPDTTAMIRRMCIQLKQQGYDTSPLMTSQLAHYQRLLKQQEGEFGANSAEVATTLLALADCLPADQEAQREAILRRALDIRTQLWGDDHPQTMEAIMALAECLCTRSDPAKVTEGIELLRRLATSPIAMNNPMIANKVQHLTHNLVDRGMGDQVAHVARARLAQLDKQLKAQEASNGINHPDVATTLLQIADCHATLGSHEAREVAARRALTIRERALGMDAPLTAEAVLSLADALVAQPWSADKLNEATILLHRLAIHPLAIKDARVAAGIQRLSDRMITLGRGSDMVPVHEARLIQLQKSLSEAEAKYGAESAHCADILVQLSDCHRALGQWDGAEGAARRASELRATIYGPDHPYTLQAETQLLDALVAQPGDPDKVKEAIRLANKLACHPSAMKDAKLMTIIEHAIEVMIADGHAPQLQPSCRSLVAERARQLRIIEQQFGPGSVEAADALMKLAQAHVATGNAAAGEAAARRAMVIREQVLGTDHPDTIRSMAILSQALVASGDPAKVAEGARLLARVVASPYSVSDPSLVQMVQNTSESLTHQGYDRSMAPVHRARLQQLEQLLKEQQARGGVGNPEAINTLLEIAKCHDALGDQASRENAARAAYDIAQSQLPPDHPLVLASQAALAEALIASGDPAKISEGAKMMSVLANNPSAINDPAIRDAITRAATSLQAAGQHVAAEPLLRAALATAEQALRDAEAKYGPNSEQAAAALLAVADAHASLGNTDQREAAARRAADIRSKVWGSDHPKAAQAQAALAASLLANDDPVKRAEGMDLVKQLASNPIAMNDPKTQAMLAKAAQQLAADGHDSELQQMREVLPSNKSKHLRAPPDEEVGDEKSSSAPIMRTLPKMAPDSSRGKGGAAPPEATPRGGAPTNRSLPPSDTPRISDIMASVEAAKKAKRDAEQARAQQQLAKQNARKQKLLAEARARAEAAGEGNKPNLIADLLAEVEREMANANASPRAAPLRHTTLDRPGMASGVARRKGQQANAIPKFMSDADKAKQAQEFLEENKLKEEADKDAARRARTDQLVEEAMKKIEDDMKGISDRPYARGILPPGVVGGRTAALALLNPAGARGESAPRSTTSELPPRATAAIAATKAAALERALGNGPPSARSSALDPSLVPTAKRAPAKRPEVSSLEFIPYVSLHHFTLLSNQLRWA
jgi:hypothetical protein